MQLRLVLFIVAIYFIILTSQQADSGAYHSDKKFCEYKLMKIRMKIMEFFAKLNQSFGLTKPLLPKKLKLCFITTTTTTTTTSTTTTTTTTTTPATCTIAPSSLVPLYQLYNPSVDDHFYTTSSSEADNAVSAYGYMKLSSPGLVASSDNCPCGTSSLVPVYRFYRPSNHFYTASEDEANYVATNLGFTSEGISWYCSSELGVCGATLPLFRYLNNADHIYVTDISQAQGTYEGITCYIWPG